MPTEKLVTATELEQMPDGEEYELVRGRLVPVTPPGDRHGQAAVILAAELRAHVRGNRLGRVRAATGFVLFRQQLRQSRRAISGGMHGRVALAALVAMLSETACNDYTPPSPRPTPGSIAIHSGDEQGADVGQQLPEPLAVIVRSTAGEPMAGAEVHWLATQGGSVSPTVSVTGSDGMARAGRTVGSSLGEYMTAALTPPLFSEVIIFKSFARVDGGYLLGNRTIGPLTDTTLGTNDQPLVVMVTNEKGEPVPGVVITWQALNGGILSATSVPTDAGGESGVFFTYGPAARSYTVEANKPGLGGFTFVLTATAGNPVTIAKTNGDNLSVPAGGQVIYTVTAYDARGNAANGVRIAWAVASGGGNITPAENFTGGNGTATATRTLGASAGAQTATAAAPELPSAPSVTFTTNAGSPVRQP